MKLGSLVATVRGKDRERRKRSEDADKANPSRVYARSIGFSAMKFMFLPFGATALSRGLSVVGANFGVAFVQQGLTALDMMTKDPLTSNTSRQLNAATGNFKGALLSASIDLGSK